MLDNSFRTHKMTKILVKLLPLLAFVVPIAILYFLDPLFDKTWKGRIFYVFFLWLVSLELILSWEELQTGKIEKTRSVRTVAFFLALLLPTAYVLISNFYGLNTIIENLALGRGILQPWAHAMPLSTEYLVFATLFGLIVLMEYGVRGLKVHSISAVFLGVIGAIYTIDNVFPYGSFTPFQIIVPTTASLAAKVLNFMGYRTIWQGITNGMPTLIAIGPHGSYPATIAWPCSGVESLLIYAVTILLFLRKSTIPLDQRVAYFVYGAAATYFINVLRIVTIFTIGANGGDAMAFHDYYGQLYSISWIVFYPLLIMGSRAFWGKIGNGGPVKNGSTPTS